MNLNSNTKKIFSIIYKRLLPLYMSFLVASSALAQAPANDSICNAIPLTPDAVCTYVQGTTVNATATTGVGVPACANFNSGTTRDVWYTAVVPAGGALTFDMQAGSITDGGMAVYRGATCNSTVLLACDDNSSGNPNMPRVTVTGLPVGINVYVRVWARNNTPGTFGICATIPAPAPDNDEPCTATELPVGPTCSFQTFTNASASFSSSVAPPVCAGFLGGDVWFKVIVPAGITALVFDSQTGTVTDGGMAIYSGSSCNGSLTALACDDDNSTNGNMPAMTVGGLVPGDTVWVRFWENGNNNNGTFGICVTLPPPPPSNDDPCNAIELTVDATCNYQTFTNQDATASSILIPDPACADYAGGDVWFKVVVPAEGGIMLDAQTGTMTDGGMAVYSGNCNTLSLLACNDNSSVNGNMPTINLGGLTPGDTLWVRFWEVDNNNNGTFGICATVPPPPPSNDEVCTAIELTPDIVCNYQTFSNMDATGSVGMPDPGCADYAGGDVWFKVIVPAEGALSFDAQTGVITDGGMALYSGSSCSGTLTLLTCDDDASVNGFMPSFTVGGLTPGDTLWLRFWETGNDNNGTFGLCVSIPPPAPSNDDPCGAMELTPDIVCNYQTFTTESATGTIGVEDPGCANYSGSDVWFKVVVPAGGSLIFDTQAGVITDGGMAAYTGTCNNLTLLDCDDDASDNGLMPFLSLTNLTEGDTIFVRVWEYGGNDNGTFGLCVKVPPPPPANDDPCASIELTVDATCNYQVFTNESSSDSPNVPDPGCANYNGSDVWFKVVVPAGGAIAFDTQEGEMTDGGMAVYSGTCEGLTLLSCDNNTSANGLMPKITVGGLNPGDTIYVRIWSPFNDDNGTFGICASIPPPPPANDDPCTAVDLTVGATCTFQSFTNEDATGTTGVTAPGCASYQGSDVWFKAVVPAGGAIVIDTEEGQMTDGGMAIYSGTCGTLNLLACDDNSSANGLMPKLTAGGLTEGDTVFVRVWSNSNDNNGTFGICASIPPPPPANDNPCTAIALTPDSNCIYQTFTNENALSSIGVPAPGCASYQGGDVWFSVVVPSGGALIFDTETGVITDGGMALYSGTCNNLTLIDCDDDGSDNGLMPMISVGGLTPGDTIWARVWEYGGDNNGEFGICVKMPPPGPANDDPCGAFELPVAATCTYQQFTSESAYGTSGAPAPGCGFYQGADVWFKAVVPAEGAITFDTQAGEMTDGAMAVYTGSCNNLTLIECDEDDGSGLMPKMTIGGLNPGDTVWVRVWEEGGNNNGTFGICFTIPPPPPGNDNPCGAISLPITDSCQYQTFSNEGSFGTASVPAPPCGNYQGADVWFQLIAPSTGAVNINTQGISISDAAMAIYVADSCNGTMTLLACDDNGSSNPSMPYITATGILPGTPVYIRVWSTGGTLSAGTFGICAVSPPLQPATFSFTCARDTVFTCGGGDSCFTLDAVIPDIHALTDRYAVNPISSTSSGGCFNPYIFPGGEGPSTDLSVDDTYTDVITLPFTFPFFGTNYNSLIASTNGYVSFDVSEATNFSHWDIVDGSGPRNLPTPDGFYDRALIMGPYHDLNPFYNTSPTQRIKYNVTGQAPHRRWILSFYKVPLFLAGECDTLIENTHQIVLYEGTGIVEVFIFDKQNCMGWNEGRAMVGMQDFSRTRGIMAPGRAATDAPWGRLGMNESWRFVPIGGPTLFKRVELFDTSGNFLATGDTSFLDSASLKVNFTNLCALNRLPAGLNTLIIRSTYQKFDDPTQEEVGADTITIFIPNLRVNYDITPVQCNAPGAIAVHLTSGVAPLQFSIDSAGVVWQSDSVFNNLAAGTYYVKVKDAAGCAKDTIIMLNGPDTITALYASTNPSCNGGTNGTIAITAAGGTPGYEYSANGGTTYQTSDTLVVGAGTFAVRIRDTNGCFKDTSITITEPSAITATYAVSPVKCFAANSGSIIVTASGGTPGYTYSLNSGTPQAEDSFAVVAGNHTIRITDANGCTKDSTITVTQPAQLTASAAAVNAGCSQTSLTGQVTVTATGGTAPYAYSSNGTDFQASNNFTGLGSASYTITVRDSNNCVVTTGVTVGVTNDLTLQTRQDTTICGAVSVGLYTTTNAEVISWQGTNLSSNTVASPVASPTAIGTAQYIVTAQTGTCIDTDTVNIIVTAPPVVDAGMVAPITKGQDAQLNGTVSNATNFAWTPTTYLNNPAILTPMSVMPQQTITYTLTATNAQGCSTSDTVTVTVLPFCIKVKNAFTPNGDGVNDNWMVYDQFDCLKNVSVQVFNRYGSRVFESKNYRNSWQGTYSGKNLPDATYYYVIDFLMQDGRNYQVRGDVTILR